MDNFHIDEKVKPKGLTKIELGRLQNTTLSKEQ